MMQKIQKSFFLLLFLAINFYFINNVSAYSFSDGNGSRENPYHITSCLDLNAIRDELSASYILINNIDCSDTNEWNSDSEYEIEIFTDYWWAEETLQLGARNVSDVIIYIDGEEINPENYVVDYENGEVYINYEFEGTVTADYSYYAGFEPIGNAYDYFTGNFNGNNYSITGLTINRGDTNYVGLFGFVTGNITNTKLVDANIFGYIRVGGLAGRLYDSNISNSSVSGIIRGAEYVGGLVGGSYLGNISDSNTNVIVNGLKKYSKHAWDDYDTYIYTQGDFIGGLVGGSSGTITNSHSAGTVTTNGYDNDEASIGGLVGVSTGTISNSSSSADVNGEWAVGGLVGSASGTILNSYATGKIYGEADYVGGLVGSLEADVNNSYATGIVEGSGYVGGLIGVSDGGGVYYSHAIGNVTGAVRVGGLIGGTNADINHSFATGNVFGSNEKIGGLIGSMIFNKVQFSYAIGTISGGGNLMGGLVGGSYYSTITDSYSWSNVTGGSKIGGLVGYADNGASIHRCYSKGTVEGNDYVGGLVGELYYDLVENSFTTSQITINDSEYYGGAIGNLEGSTNDYIDNIFWFNHQTAELECYVGGNENCYTIGNNDGNTTSYFYNPNNEPLSEWNFEDIWLQRENNYPILRIFSEDTDSDGVPNTADPLLFTETSVTKTGLTNDLNILVGGQDTNQIFSGEKEIIFYDGNNLLMDFNFNFDENNLDLSKVSIIKSTSGIVVDLNGQLQNDKNKTLYLTNNNFVGLCVKNTNTTALSEISSSCNGTSEYNFTNCLTNGTQSQAGINCDYNSTSGIITISNLRYSGVKGFLAETNTSTSNGSCSPIWNCSNWSTCINGNQTRSCTKTNNCGALNQGKPIEQQTCATNGTDNNLTNQTNNNQLDNNQINNQTDINKTNINQTDKNNISTPQNANQEKQNNDYIWIIAISAIIIFGASIFIALKQRKKE
jgi:hypothetical protein